MTRRELPAGLQRRAPCSKAQAPTPSLLSRVESVRISVLGCGGLRAGSETGAYLATFLQKPLLQG